MPAANVVFSHGGLARPEQHGGRMQTEARTNVGLHQTTDHCVLSEQRSTRNDRIDHPSGQNQVSSRFEKHSPALRPPSLLDQYPEVIDGLRQARHQFHFRHPSQSLARRRDVGLPLLRIVAG
jgi:hypothetical protein